MKKKLIISTLLLPLFACSSGSDSTTTPTTKTGVFVDSPVIGIGYKTETLSGATNSNGEYEFLPGETVTFFIGDLELPPTLATGTVTPLDLAATQDTSNSTVVNIIRLLQTLDKDGDPDNGITITDTAISNATQVDFSQDIASFESSTAVDVLINNAGLDTPVAALISTVDAIANFEQGLDESFSVDMSQTTASSVITFSSCPSDPLGWNYTFTATSMTLTGSDSWQTPACTTGAEESITLNNMTTLASDFDIPFNCVAYPICQSADFNKVLSGADDDGRDFTSTYTFNRQTSVLTYVKSVEGTTFTEVITIQ